MSDNFPVNHITTQMWSGHGKWAVYLRRFQIKPRAKCICGYEGEQPTHQWLTCDFISSTWYQTLREINFDPANFPPNDLTTLFDLGISPRMWARIGKVALQNTT